MNGKERVLRTLNREPVDRLPICEEFWPETVHRWSSEGRFDAVKVNVDEHFGMDISLAGGQDFVADLDFEPRVIEETDDTILKMDGNGAVLRWMKHRSDVPEHVNFKVKDRAGWEEFIKPHLTGPLHERRVSTEHYRPLRAECEQTGRAFGFCGLGPFECIHPMCGHEHMLMGMAMDPEWVADMVMTYVDLSIRTAEKIFEQEGLPDLVWVFEDMGFKERPFMSPEMYGELVQPGHKKLFGFYRSLGLKVVVHSCGFIEPMVPGLIEAGMDCLQALEVKAGMDVHRLAEKHGDVLAFCGNLDIRELISNDFERIDREMDRVIAPLIEKGCSYIVHSDHSVPSEVNYESMRHWVERAQGYRLKS